MPQLIEYIKVGICSGYGDGDFSVSMSVQSLSREQWNEVQLATLTALAVAREKWLAAQADKEPRKTLREHPSYRERTKPDGK